MPKIAEIQTIPFRLPMRGSLHWGRAGRLDALEHVLVRLVTEGGQVGLAEAPPRPTIYGETPESIQAIIRNYLAPALIGLEIDRVELANQRMAAVANNPTAKGAIDIALHEALAASRGMNLGQWLGATQKRIRVSYILGMADRKSMLAEARAVYERGVRVLKVKVGRDFEHDLALLRDLLAEFAGSDLALYADANECFTPGNAPDRLRRLAGLGLLYVEEPLPVRLLRERAALQRAGFLPLIADDSAFTPDDLARELAFDTFDILNIKTARTGYFHSRQMLEAALARGKGVMVGSQASSTLGAVRAAAFAGLAGVSHPSELSFFLKLEDEIVDRPLAIREGYIDLDEALEIGLDEDRLARCRR